MPVFYAIGDVHGQETQLARLHAQIAADINGHGQDAHIVHLGDLIDRGPDSRATLARVLMLEQNPPPRTTVCALMGNHEELALEALRGRDPTDFLFWMRNGGDATLESYERSNGAHEDWRDSLDAAHVSFLMGLATTLRFDKLVFVHAGIDPRRFPSCPAEVRRWTRSPIFFKDEQWPYRDEIAGLTIVHGHTPTDDFRPYVGPQRINVDTGAVFGGPLTCAVIAPEEKVRFLTA